MLNELKPEDVMMALKCCVTADHNLCPYRGDWSCDHTLVTNALALLREKDAEIERLRKRRPGRKQILAGIGNKRPVVMLSAAIDSDKGLLVE